MAATNTNPALVLAWEVVRYGDEDASCAFYCQTVDGAVFSTGFRPYTREVRDNFKVKGDTWTRVGGVPAGAEFIGTYAKPAAL